MDRQEHNSRYSMEKPEHTLWCYWTQCFQDWQNLFTVSIVYCSDSSGCVMTFTKPCSNTSKVSFWNLKLSFVAFHQPSVQATPGTWSLDYGVAWGYIICCSVYLVSITISQDLGWTPYLHPKTDDEKWTAGASLNIVMIYERKRFGLCLGLGDSIEILQENRSNS